MVDYAEEGVRREPLQDMFAAIPPRYDMINHIITWGLDKRWRRMAAKECLHLQPRNVLDMCSGTGDLVIDLARLARNDTELIGIDYSQPMLDVAGEKAKLLIKEKKISFTCGNAANVPFPDEYFDCIGITFSFRNLTYKNPLAQRHIAEILRLLSANGRCVIMETSQPKSKLIRKLFHLYLRCFVSSVGRLVSGNKSAYRYLAESAARFYTPEELKDILITAGFRQVYFRPLLFGAVGICVACK